MRLRLWRPIAQAIPLFLVFTALLAEGIRAKDIECDREPYLFAKSRFQELEKRYNKSIILINCGGDLPQIQNIGTGFLIDSRLGLFLTAYHVVKDPSGHYDCTKRDIGTPLVAYTLGDMCERTELEYVAGDLSLDVAILRAVKFQSTQQASQGGISSKHPFFGRPHFELLTRGMERNEELELIGFSQFAGILNKGGQESDILPGIAGGHTCIGQPQPYKFNPLHIRDQRVDDRQASYLRDSNVHEGDSGAPIFLEDGRVVGLASEITYRTGTKVVAAAKIVKWMSVLRLNKTLDDQFYSLETWPNNRDIYEALDPDTCFRSNSCIPNIWLASELERISTGGVNFEKFTNDDRQRLRCPVYAAAEARDIRPQMDFLRDKLKEYGVIVTAEGYISERRARKIVASSKYTGYTKIAALEIAEASLARDLDSLEEKSPGILAGAICASGVSTAQIESVQYTVNNYLANFKRAESTKMNPRPVNCPGNQDPAELKQARDITSMIKDIKIAQVSLAKSMGGPQDSSSSATASALAALVNTGNKQGAKALIDLADTLVPINPDLAASAYAKAFDINGSTRAKTGFRNAVGKSPELQAKMPASPHIAGWEAAIKSFPTIDTNHVADFITKSGLEPGTM